MYEHLTLLITAAKKKRPITDTSLNSDFQSPLEILALAIHAVVASQMALRVDQDG